MNIFVIHQKRRRAARALCDKHVVKMVLETAQILCSAFACIASPTELCAATERLEACGGRMYRPTHANHPCVVWAHEQPCNFKWLCKYGLALAKEYTHRYGKEHKSEKIIRVLLEEIREHIARTRTDGRRQRCRVKDFALAIPDDIRGDKRRARPHEAVTMYREYYRRKLLEPWAVYTKGRPMPVFLDQCT